MENITLEKPIPLGESMALPEAVSLRKIGRVERGKRRDCAPGAIIAQPFAAQPHDAFARAENAFRCRAAK
jgi:hypothetical protein